MMKKLMIGTGLMAMLMAGGVAIAAPGGMARGPMGGDANQDGTLTKGEVTAHVEQRFAERDANKDGKITQEDRALQRQARQDARFKQLDADGNGQISRAEFDAANAKREAAREEFRGKMGDRADARAGERGEHRMHRKGGMHRGMGHHGGMGPMMDADKDGTITKAEFMAPALARFERMDANKDGQVTKEERQAARAEMRTKPAPQKP